MTEDAKTVWGMHSYDDNLFLKKNTLGIGWAEMGDLTKIGPTRDTFKAHYAECFPEDKPSQVPGRAGQLYRFLHEMKEGDFVVYPSKTDHMVNIGVVDGPYVYNEAYKGTQLGYAQQRSVRWLKHLPRTDFTQGALYEIGSALTLFMVKNYADEFLSALDPGFKPSSSGGEEDETVAATAADIKQATVDFIIKMLSRDLKGYSLEDYVADLLQAMGYRTTVSKKGGDRGIDIVAYKDELPPRILVQVKSTDGNVDERTIQSLKGAMHEGDYGLFVTLSSYTRNAKKYLDNTPIIRGIDGQALAELVLKYYGLMSEKYQKVIPLEMVYIPVILEG